jgi:hypothetical protein
VPTAQVFLGGRRNQHAGQVWKMNLVNHIE